MAGTPRTRNARRTLIINESLQKRIIVAVTLFPTLALSISALIVAIFCRRLLGESANAEVELPSLVPLFLSVLGFVVACCLIVLHQALRFSHRIAGPAYRIVRCMAQLREGQPVAPITLRDGDFLIEIAEELNELSRWVQGARAGGPAAAAVPGEPEAAPLNDVPAPLAAEPSEQPEAAPH
jgi:hypothetical protein